MSTEEREEKLFGADIFDSDEDRDSEVSVEDEEADLDTGDDADEY